MSKPIQPFHTEFRVGQRVRVHFPEIDPQDIQCNIGVIIAARVQHPRSPDSRKVFYHVIFDEPVLKSEAIQFNSILTVEVEAKRLEAVD